MKEVIYIKQKRKFYQENLSFSRKKFSYPFALSVASLVLEIVTFNS